MMKTKIAALLATAALAALAAGCNPETTTTNTTTNTNSATTTTNANTTGVAMNTNTAAPGTSSTTTTTTTRTYNANMTREDYDKDKTRFAEDAKKAGNTIGSGLEDGWLWTKTRTVLSNADDLRDSTINVDVDNNVVTLRGTVANQGQKTKAEQLAKSVKDVKSVRNDLKVSAGDSMTNMNK
jgi:hypothetical protein